MEKISTFRLWRQLTVPRIVNMKRGYFLPLALALTLLSGAALGQITYGTDKGKTEFTSDAPLEVIYAKSEKVNCIIRPANRQFTFKVLMESFQGFNSGLQRQHFCENYIECDKNPFGTFRGKIIEEVDLTQPGTYTVRAKGKLNLHGVEVERIIKSTVVVANNTIKITSTFEVPLTDHNITIPKIVFRKIAEVIKVKFDATLAPSK